jgi:hypothetical protein
MGAIRIAPFFRTQALFYTHASASRPLTAVLPQGHDQVNVDASSHELISAGRSSWIRRDNPSRDEFLHCTLSWAEVRDYQGVYISSRSQSIPS